MSDVARFDDAPGRQASDALEEGVGPTEFRDDPGYLAIWLTVSLVIAGLLSFAGGPGIIIAAIAAIYAVWFGVRLVRPKVRLRVREEGLLDENFWYSPGLIPWENIVDIRLGRLGIIEVELRDERIFYDGLNPLQAMPRVKWQFWGLGPASITPWLLEGSAEEIVEELQAGLDAYTLRSGARSPAIPEGPVSDTGRPRLPAPDAPL